MGQVRQVTACFLVGVIALSGCDNASTPVAPGATYVIDRRQFTQFQLTRLPQIFCLSAGNTRTMELRKGISGHMSVSFSRITQEYCGEGNVPEVFGPTRELTEAEEDAVRAAFRRVEVVSASRDCIIFPEPPSFEVQWDSRQVYESRCTVDHLSSASLSALLDLARELESPTTARLEVDTRSLALPSPATKENLR